MGLSDPESWAYLRPILTENQGWALFISTPRRKNHAHRMYEAALSEPEHWFALVSTVDDTDVISNERLAIDHREWMKLYGEVQGDAFFRQEYLHFRPRLKLRLYLLPVPGHNPGSRDQQRDAGQTDQYLDDDPVGNLDQDDMSGKREEGAEDKDRE